MPPIKYELKHIPRVFLVQILEHKMERLISNQSNSGVLKCDSNIKSIITVDIHINFATNHQLTKKEFNFVY